MTLHEKVQKGLDCWCDRFKADIKDDCKKYGCPYADSESECSTEILWDVDILLRDIAAKDNANEKDFKLIEDNLKNALEYQQNLNQQITGRLDAYQSIVRMTLKILIDAATERR